MNEIDLTLTTAEYEIVLDALDGILDTETWRDYGPSRLRAVSRLRDRIGGRS